jgi:hypothetical protein
MKLRDRAWERTLRRRVSMEVAASPTLRARRKAEAVPVWRSHRSVPAACWRACVFMAWLGLAGVPQWHKIALLLLPYWGACLLAARWSALSRIPVETKWVAHLPLAAATYGGHLWRCDARRAAVFGLEAAVVLAVWLSAEGGGLSGLAVGAMLGLLAGLATLALGAGVAISRWIVIPQSLLVGVVVLLLFCLVARKIFPETVLWLIETLRLALLWLTPTGWAMQAAEAWSQRAWLLVAAFTGALSILAAALPIWRARLLWLAAAPDRSSADLLFQSEDEDESVLPAARVESPEEAAAANVAKIKGGALAASGAPDDPVAAWLWHRFGSRAQLVFQVLLGDAPGWWPRWKRALRFAVLGTLAVALLPRISPAAAVPGFLIWAGLLHFRLPLFGGFWPLLSASAGATRQVAAFAVLPLREGEMLRVILLANTLRFVLLAPVLIAAMATAQALLGRAFVESALRESLLLAMLWLAQPILLIFRLTEGAHLTGFRLLVLLMAAILCGLAWSVVTFSCLAGDHLVISKFVTLTLPWYAALWVLAALYLRRHVRGRIDLVK